MASSRIRENLMRVLGGAAVLVAALICMVALGSSRKAVAASSLCNVYVELKAESSGYVTGEVGQAINPYFFTMTIVKNPSTDVNYEVAGIDPKFQKDYAAGADVTDWFRGQIDEVAGKYRILPKGLAVTLVDAIHAGDTTARLKISGTPLMGANWYMPFSSYESAFCSESFLNGLSARDKKLLQKPAEISYGLRFDIGRKSSSWQTGGVSVSSLKISGSAGSAVTQKELTYTIKNGNFLVDLPQGKDVSDWFRSTMYLYNWNTQEYVYCRLPAGMKVTLKKAVKAGDRSCTFVFSGTPTCGSKDCIAIIIPGDGTVSTSSEGTMRAECGYSETGWYSSNFDFMYNISGDIVRPEITVDDASISGTVGHAIADAGSNIITFHLSNCTLARTIEAGSRDLSGCLIDVRPNGEYSALDQYGLYAEVVRFVYGEDYFKIKITGTPQKNGSLNIIIRLFEEDTDAGCRIKSKTNGNARFAFSSPDTGAHAYISSKEVTTMQGFAVDTEEMCFVAGFLTGEDAGSEVKYVVNGTFAKDQDVSKYFDGLPGGLKAYAAKDMTDPAEMEVYLKGVPTSAYRYEVKFKVAPYEWAKKTKAAGSNTWTTELQSNSHDSYATFVINTVDNKVNHVFAYPYSLDPHDENTGAISGLPYDKMVEAVDKVPIRVGGNLSVHKQVVVENGVARLENKTTYTNHGANIWLYIPRLYLSKAYAAGSSVNDIVRLKAVDSAGNLVDAPITGYNIVTETALEKGTKIGVNVLLYIEGIGATATESFEGLAIQVYTHSAFMNAVMPANSAFEIAQVVTGSDPADVSKCNGLRATIGNCSINGIFGMTLEDSEGLSVTVTGDTFKKWNRGQDVSDWFTNMPAGLYAIVRDSVEAGETSTIRIQFAKRNKQNKVTKVTPTGSVSCRDAIEISVPFSALVGGCSGGAYAGVDGIVVAAVNGKAKFNILSAADLNSSGKPMIVSHNFTGVYKAGQPIGEGFEETIVYLPNVGQLDEEGNRPFVELIAKEGDFVDQYLDGRTFPVGHSEAKKQSNGIWTMSVSANKNDIYAARYCEDSLSAVVNLMGRQYEVTDTYLTYTISDHAAEELSEDVVPGDDEGEEGDAGAEPDIWAGGKDDKKNGIFRKTLTKAVSELGVELPEGCKYVVSVTGTDVSDAAGAFASGKGKKNSAAKASYKKNDGGTVTVSAGKLPAGSGSVKVRVWIAAVDKKKAVQSSAYFDVTVGAAPKKIYITNDDSEDPESPVKSIALSVGETVILKVHANGSELSSYARFSWEALKADGIIKITPSKDTHSAVVTVVSAPSGGKVVKASLIVTNVESAKKAKVSVPVSNELVAVTGLEAEKHISSALEAAVEESLSYSFACSDGTSATTDKIKVYVTSATEEGEGYTLSNNKFKLTRKSKVKVTYKNGEFKLKAPKKTPDGTTVRVLIVATHADKTVSVFESGIITIG